MPEVFMDELYDVIIIGGASAGLTAAIYTSRRAMKTLVLTKDIGGQLSTTPDVENYPGYESIEGWTLTDKFKKQAELFGAEIKFSEVSAVTPKDDDTFEIIANGKSYIGRSVILAFGKTPRNLDVPGEKDFQGKGVSYCATCDMPLYKGKTLAIVGGGNSALDAAVYGSALAEKIYLVHRRDQYRGEQVLIDRMKEKKNVEPIYNAVAKEVKGDTVVRGLVITDVHTGEERELAVDGIFVEIGHIVKSEFIKDLVEMTEKNEVKVDDHQMTSVPGIFAAGDITTSAYKQAVVSAGEGCIAALASYEYLMKQEGKRPTKIDWGTTEEVKKID
jgi:thioredoxin-disulfide reductase